MNERSIRGAPESRWEDFAICPATTEAILNTCREFGDIFIEFGSGIGTRRLEEAFHVITFEHDPSWMIYHNSLKIRQILAPLSNGWYYRGIVEGILERVDPEKVAGILIDGPPHLIGRSAIMNHLDILRPFMDCPIFVDDVHRQADNILLRRLSEELGRSYNVYPAEDPKKPEVKFGIIEVVRREKTNGVD